MPTKERGKPGSGPDELEDDEVDRRMAVLDWLDARKERGEAERELMAAANAYYVQCDESVEELTRRLEEAEEREEDAKKAMFSGRPKAQGKRPGEGAEQREEREMQRQQREDKVRSTGQNAQQIRADQNLTEADIRQRQQDLERKRIELETAEAARNLDKAGAPGMPAQPGEAAQRAPADISRKSSATAEADKPTENVPPRVGAKAGTGPSRPETSGQDGSPPPRGGGKQGRSGKDASPQAKKDLEETPDLASQKVAQEINAISRPSTGDPDAPVTAGTGLSGGGFNEPAGGVRTVEQEKADAFGRAYSGQRPPSDHYPPDANPQKEPGSGRPADGKQGENKPKGGK